MRITPHRARFGLLLVAAAGLISCISSNLEPSVDTRSRAAHVRATNPATPTAPAVDWTNVDTTSSVAQGTLRSTSVTLAGGQLDYGVTDGTFTGFNDASLFDPPLQASDVVGFRGGPSSYSYTVAFSKPVTNPLLYLESLGSTLTFSLPTNVTIERVSGDAGFTVAGSVVAGVANDWGGFPNDSNGIVRLKGTMTSIAFTAYWDQSQGDGIYLQIAIGACQIPSVPLLKQSGPQAPWSFNPYDNRCTDEAVCRGASAKYDCGLSPKATKCTIGYLGCYLTSAAMLLAYHGVAVTPGELNDYLSQRLPGPVGCASCYVGYSHGLVKPGAIETFASSRGIALNYRGNTAASRLAESICDYGPQITGINNGNHWIIATGAKDGAGTAFLVNDPASGLGGNRTEVPTAQIAAVRVFSGPNSPAVNPSAIVVRVYSPAELMVEDPIGRRVGWDSTSASRLTEIPQGTYQVIGLGDDNGEADVDPAKEVEILAPMSGAYRIEVLGTGAGTYDLDVFLTDSSGQRNELTLDHLPVAEGSDDEYSLGYDQEASPGIIVRAVPDTLWPPNNKLVTVRPQVVVPTVSGTPAVVRLLTISCNDDCDPRRDILGAAIGTDDREFQLRASQRHDGSGRKYVITYSATSVSGAVSTASVEVTVERPATKPAICHSWGCHRRRGPTRHYDER